MFQINGYKWNIVFIEPYSDYLRRSDGSLTVGVTDFPKRTVFLSNLLQGAFLRKVLCHELTHCFSFSFDISLAIEEEERMADFISIYGTDLVYLLDDLMVMLKSAVA